MRERPRIFYGRTRDSSTAHQPDPYGTSSPGYAERNRVTVTEVSPGMVMESYGAPVTRLAGEAQPVDLGIPEVPQPEPVAVPVVAPAEPVQVAKQPRKRDWRDDFGLLKSA